MRYLEEEINLLEEQIQFFEKSNKNISKGSIGWHIAHSTMVIGGIISSLENSNPLAYKNKFNWKRIFVFTTKKIPRGKGKAPERVNPTTNITKQNLDLGINKAKQKLEQLNNLPKDSFFTHPFFGDLNLKNTIKFLKIHTNHHIKIIDDISK